ncbi:hypothetical protein BC937DRAFT_86682 [Endogone sp. FLAS-F59071]|nr:hypothetical protein BC937DRAFT_86682 [Endogone sp. FLAS-F59071]|eukprot:RUS19943.1 hypothetical protein BC937DRAFT_86682 [Endogone sp. FLAS-F59071]
MTWFVFGPREARGLTTKQELWAFATPEQLPIARGVSGYLCGLMQELRQMLGHSYRDYRTDWPTGSGNGLPTCSDHALVSQYAGVIESATQPMLTLNSTADASTDKFRGFGTAFRTAWFFLNGDWGPLDIVASWIINLLALMFSFTTAIVLLNVLMQVALMSDVVGRKGKRIWVQYLAGYIAEIKVYWSFVSKRENKRNQPTHVYYVAYTSTIERWQQHLNRNRNDPQVSDENTSNDEGPK